MNPLGIYTPKAGYKVLSSRGDLGVQRWWWKKVWKFKCPSKSHIFIWLLLNNKVLTWDILQKRNKHGPRRCPMCKENEETNFHLIMSCPYSI
jgi:hypothetical protein